MLSAQRAATKKTKKVINEDRLCLWYAFEDQVKSRPQDAECIWSRSGCYTWRETYDQACRYGNYLKNVAGVRPRDLVATMLTNHPEFVFHWFGLWSIGCAPAMINHHLSQEALLHCINLSGSRTLVVDADSEVSMRVFEIRQTLDDLGINIIVLDDNVKASINAMPPTRPDDELRRGMGADYPICLIYTR